MTTTGHGPTAACQRTTCTRANAPAHVGGAQLDPSSALYDGPDISLRALPVAVREPAFALLHTARTAGWDMNIVNTALHACAEEIHRLAGQVAAVRVDRDRGIRDAMARAEDCEEHGQTIRFEAHQAYWFSRLADRNDAERIVWMTGVYSLAEGLARRTDDISRAVVEHLDRVARNARRTRQRGAASTLAECQRAGTCEHRAPGAPAACRQLADAGDPHQGGDEQTGLGPADA